MARTRITTVKETEYLVARVQSMDRLDKVSTTLINMYVRALAILNEDDLKNRMNCTRMI